jgi:hypothetical protein
MEQRQSAVSMPFAEMAEIVGQVRLILSTEPVSVIYCAAYQAFAREIRKQKRLYMHRPDLMAHVSVVLAKWKNWKLDERIMNRILAEIFELPVACCHSERSEESLRSLRDRPDAKRADQVEQDGSRGGEASTPPDGEEMKS